MKVGFSPFKLRSDGLNSLGSPGASSGWLVPAVLVGNPTAQARSSARSLQRVLLWPRCTGRATSLFRRPQGPRVASRVQGGRQEGHLGEREAGGQPGELALAWLGHVRTSHPWCKYFSQPRGPHGLAPSQALAEAGPGSREGTQLRPSGGRTGAKEPLGWRTLLGPSLKNAFCRVTLLPENSLNAYKRAVDGRLRSRCGSYEGPVADRHPCGRVQLGRRAGCT